jgi:dienelactone hydrolase
MDPSAIPLMDKITAPSSWFTTIFYKPAYIFKTLTIAIPWKKKTAIPITYPQVVAFFQALRTSPPPMQTSNLKVGAAGFCWGGKHTFLLAQDSPSNHVKRHESQETTRITESMKLIDCAFTAHPSYIELPNDVDAINIPLSIAIGDVDMNMKIDKVEQMKNILDGKKEKHEVVIVKGAKHGFAIRTHPDDEAEMECAEKAEVQAIEWFGKWFS